MAMTILNNTSAMMTLGELNKNVNRVGKDLKKLSSGMKINSTGDDASAYAISERMRVQIRGLDQDVQNVQNGRSLLNVAAGGIDNIVEELRSLKELAINAANDTNTDLDRATMQKEFNHRKANINDIATETNYNGMPLLDGRWCRYKAEDDMIVSNSGSGLFANSGLTAVVADPVRGKTCPECAWINGRNVYEGDRNTEYSLDFSSAVNAYGNTPNFPYDMDGEGFFIVCAGNNDGTTASGTNDRYDWHASSHSITFDADMSVGTATAGYLDDYKNFSITVGIAEVRSADDLAAAIYQGVSSLVGVESEFTKLGSTVSIDSKYGDHIHITDNGNGDYSLRRDYGIWLYEGYLDVEEGRDPNMLIIHSGTRANQNVGVNINDMHTLSLKGDVPNAEDISRLERTIPSNYMENYYEALENRGAVTPREKYPVLSAYVSELASTCQGSKIRTPSRIMPSTGRLWKESGISP